MATTIRLQHVTKTFEPAGYSTANESTTQTSDTHQYYALNDVSLTVRPGEILCILGPSGCGKTTLLRIIAGLLEPTHGDVFYDNENIKDIPLAERGVGMVFENYALYPHLPSVENIGFFLRLRKREHEVPERVREISELMRIDLAPLLSRKPPTLSGGEQQRIAIARCLARDPRVFLFDEPFSNLDAKYRTSARIELKRLLQRYQVTSVYVTHDQVEAIALADRIVILNHGKLEQIGTYRHLYETPRNIFVAGFLGNPAMNLFSGYAQQDRWIGQYFEWGPIRSDLPDGLQIVLGVRPEHFVIDPQGPITAEVILVEPIFSERVQLVHARINDLTVVVRAPFSPTIARQDIIKISVMPEHIHLFDAKSGARIG